MAITMMAITTMTTGMVQDGTMAFISMMSLPIGAGAEDIPTTEAITIDGVMTAATGTEDVIIAAAVMAAVTTTKNLC